MEQNCLRNEENCPLAHPSSSINIVEGTVTCCFDFIKVMTCEKDNVEQFGIIFRTGPLPTNQLSILPSVAVDKGAVSRGGEDACTVKKSK